MAFKPRSDMERALASETAMRQYLQRVADEAARDVEARLPHPRILGGIKVEADTARTAEGWHGEVKVIGPGWHLWEFGTQNHGAQPAIRPGVQATLSRYGGRFQGDRSG